MAGVRECAWPGDLAGGPAQGLWIDVVELGGSDEAVAVVRSRGLATLIGASKGPIPSSNGEYKLPAYQSFSLTQ
jgi:hypothetical protein